MSSRTSHRTDTEFLSRYLEGLPLKRISGEGPAGLVTASVPGPRGGPQALSLGGQPTHVIPLGQWHDVDPDVPAPRRLLLTADAGSGPASASINVSASARGGGKNAPLPTATEHVFAHG